jgi:hypothetical protein
MAKNIFQLAKLSRRLPRRLRHARAELQRLINRDAPAAVLMPVALRAKQLDHDLDYVVGVTRLIENTPAHRCALPKRVQRNLGLLPALS